MKRKWAKNPGSFSFRTVSGWDWVFQEEIEMVWSIITCLLGVCPGELGRVEQLARRKEGFGHPPSIHLPTYWMRRSLEKC